MGWAGPRPPGGCKRQAAAVSAPQRVQLSHRDAQGRPSIAWSQTDATGQYTRVYVKRYSAALP